MIALSEDGDAKVYLYEFSTRPVISTKPDFIIADHLDDVFFTFGMSNLEMYDGMPCDMGLDGDRKRIEDATMQAWANFAKSG